MKNLHISICKQIFSVQKQTTNVGVLLELGRIPLDIYAKKFAIKNWERIRLNQANCLLLRSYNDALREDLPRISNIKTLLEGKGMLNDFLYRPYVTQKPFIYNKLFQRLSDEFHQNAFETIRSVGSKLRTYALFKNKIGIENYLLQINNRYLRKYMTRFRLSNHRLMIEIGRHQNTPKECRFCPFCRNLVETEAHFLLECPVYESLRSRMLEPIYSNKPYLLFYTNEEKFQHLLSMSENNNICQFLSKAFELREFLISKPKRIW